MLKLDERKRSINAYTATHFILGRGLHYTQLVFTKMVEIMKTARTNKKYLRKQWAFWN